MFLRLNRTKSAHLKEGRQKMKNKIHIPKETEYILGVDPDTKNQAYALIDLDGRPITAWVSKSDGSEWAQGISNWMDYPLHPNTFCVIEGQEVYKDVKKSVPANMIRLARSSGIAVAECTRAGCIGIYITQPKEWKGSVQKHAKQAQIIRNLGYTPKVVGGKDKYCVPEENFLNMNQTEYKHVIDGFGIALWALDIFKWNLKKERL